MKWPLLYLLSALCLDKASMLDDMEYVWDDSAAPFLTQINNMRSAFRHCSVSSADLQLLGLEYSYEPLVLWRGLWPPS